jgi:hypothetical protein
MTPSTLTAWMTRLEYNKSEAAEALGIARTTLDRYLAGSVAIPRVVELACEAVWLRGERDALLSNLEKERHGPRIGGIYDDE